MLLGISQPTAARMIAEKQAAKEVHDEALRIFRSIQESPFHGSLTLGEVTMVLKLLSEKQVRQWYVDNITSVKEIILI